MEKAVLEMLAAQAKEAVYGLNMHMEIGALNGISTDVEPRWNGAVRVLGRHTWYGISVRSTDLGYNVQVWATADGEFSTRAVPVAGY